MKLSNSALTTEHLKFIKEGVLYIQKEEPLLIDVARQANSDRLSALLGDDFGWSYLYEVSQKQTLILFFAALGLIPKIQAELTKGKDINAFIIEMATNCEHLSEDFLENAFAHIGESPSVEEIKSVRFGFGNLFKFADLFILTYAILGHMAAMRKFGKDFFQLISEVKNGNEESFLHAIRVDPTAIACEPFVKRLSIAHMKGDSRFLALVASALKRKWKKTKDDLDPLRVVLHALNEMGTLDQLSLNEADMLLIKELHLYSDDGEDPARSLYRFIQRWKTNK